MTPALAKRISSESKSARNFWAVAETDWREDWSHSRNVRVTLGERLEASAISSWALLRLRPVKTMWRGLCLQRLRIVVLPIPAVPVDRR